MQDVKEIARRLAEDPWRGKLDEALELVGDDYVGHIPGAPEPIRGKDGFRQFVNMYLTGFPDGKITVNDQIAEGELVATRWTAQGTNTGELMAMPPTGKQVTVSGITYSRIAGDMAREAWLIWDTLSMMQQLGAVAGESLHRAARIPALLGTARLRLLQPRRWPAGRASLQAIHVP